PGDYPVHGVDTSRHNHPGNKPFDWKKLAASGQKFISIKATEGSRTRYVDPWFTRDLAGARRVHMIRTAYHYFAHEQDGVAQADHFLRTVRKQGLTGAHAYELPLEVDLEGRCGAAPSALQARVLAFLRRVKSVTGVEPTIYTQKSFIDRCMAGSKALGGYRVRLARYGQSPPPPIPGGKGWSFWQFTESASIPGIPDRTVDENVFVGDYAKLKRLANIH
ncbi:MAG: glycoside hydrolase family 25 protein, partial [Spirillospora sp.]